ncbi:transposase [Melittangium boletus]|uniref:transposase n=1 Tax=Melittangium boletus TaxID=83453 RepID=UPI0024819D1D|nr:transposase [Melittangium boletus]
MHANDRQGLERLCRYGARGALALERLSRAEDGRIAYRMKRPLPDGTTAPALHRAYAAPPAGQPGASAEVKPDEVPRRLCPRRESAASSAPSGRGGAGVRLMGYPSASLTSRSASARYAL